jgi:phage repressor protein C with HTH and peptisase S24 domain
VLIRLIIYQIDKKGDDWSMDTNTIRRENLRALAARYETQAEFASICGTAASVISLIISPNPKRNLGHKLARKIEEAIGLQSGWMDRDHPKSEVVESNATILSSGIKEWDDSTPLDDDEIELPFLKEVELSAGDGRTVVQIMGSRKLRFGKYTVRSMGVQPDQAVCVMVSGNSMEPVLQNGGTVAVDCTKNKVTDIIDGKMYAINHSGQVRVKQVYRLPRGGLRLRSFNREEHQDEDYTAEQLIAEDIGLIGRVFWGASFF